MEHAPTTTNQHEHRPNPDTPRIYVACLSAYNNGRLHGRWLHANQPTGALYEEVRDMLKNSPVPGAEEWAIHDYENFAGIGVGEYAPLDHITQVAAGVAEHGGAFAGWASEQPVGEATIEAFEDAYLGSWPDTAAYGEDLINDLGDPLQEVPDWIRPYVRIDTKQLGQDASSSLNTISGADGQVHLFDP